VHTSGVWIVKEGHEDEFVRRWQQSVDAASLELPGVVFRLQRDIERPGRFLSSAGPWRSLEQINAMRSSERFQESMASMADLLDSYDISTYELAVEVS
jgi:heme-degrading monooxygenase HmoA